MSQVSIISVTETFTVKGIVKKIQEFGMEVESIGATNEDIERTVENTAVYIIMANDSAASMVGVIDDHKDVFTAHCEHVLLIGTKNDSKIFENYLSFNEGWEFFERPIDVSDLVAKTQRIMEEENTFEKKPCILIVDDDITYCEMIRGWLKDFFRVRMANSGVNAITWLANNHADLILLDYEMPITSGPKVLEMLRSEEETADIPVIFLTGVGDKASITRVLSLKPNGYLLKSIKKKELIEQVSRFLIEGQ